MSRSDPPRLATALLRRYLHDNDPLVGDLLERFAVRQSRLWFWREALTAIVIRMFQPVDHEHPLGLGGPSELDAHEPPQATGPARHVNLTASPIPGIGGLSLAILGVLVALVRPELWWMLVPAIVGGAVFGLTTALLRRRAVLSGPPRSSRTLLQDPEDVGRRH